MDWTAIAIAIGDVECSTTSSQSKTEYIEGIERECHREMEDKLLDASIRNNVQYLENIDKLILHMYATRNFITTPLHIASSLGHVVFVKELLIHCPDLAGVLDQRRRSALHLAAEKGHEEVVSALLMVGEHGGDMCSTVDDEGRNPLHMAAMKGRLNVLKILIKGHEEVAQERVKNGQTILHLCVLHRQIEIVEELLKKPECQELINAVDDGGDTILHLAVADKNPEIVKYLAGFKCEGNNERMNLNIKNSNEYTALDLLPHSRDQEEINEETNKIKIILLDHRAKGAKDLIKNEWLTEKRESLMIVTVLIATMAFQAGVTPPGSVWQDNSGGHRAGEAVMAYNYSHYYPYFLRANTVGFVASLSIIFLLLSDLPFRKKSLMWLLILVMWLTITSMAFTYAFSITVITPKRNRASLTRTIVVGVIVWIAVMSILLIIHVVKLIKKLIEAKVEERKEYKAALAALRRPIRLISETLRISFRRLGNAS